MVAPFGEHLISARVIASLLAALATDALAGLVPMALLGSLISV